MDKNQEQEPSGAADASARDPADAKGQKVSFQEFVYLVSSQALIQLGVVPNPVSGKLEKSLPAAQNAIEILAMLERKTKGNLTQEETEVLSNALYDLRLRYVGAVQAEGTAKKSSSA